MASGLRWPHPVLRWYGMLRCIGEAFDEGRGNYIQSSVAGELKCADDDPTIITAGLLEPTAAIHCAPLHGEKGSVVAQRLAYPCGAIARCVFAG